MRALLWWTLNSLRKLTTLTSKSTKDTSRQPMMKTPTSIRRRKKTICKTLSFLSSRMALPRVSSKEWKSRKSRKCKSKGISNLVKKVCSKGSKATLVHKGLLILKLITVLLQLSLLRSFKKPMANASKHLTYDKRSANRICPSSGFKSREMEEEKWSSLKIGMPLIVRMKFSLKSNPKQEREGTVRNSDRISSISKSKLRSRISITTERISQNL